MKVNDREFALSSLKSASVLELIKHFKLKPSMVAVERNGKIEEKDNWEQIVLEDSDRIELIKFIGGG